MAANKNLIKQSNSVNNTVGGALMENNSTMQTATYEINNSQYEVVRIFGKSKDIKALITENISTKKEEEFD